MPGGVPTIGIDIGGTKCLSVALDETGQVIAEHRTDTPQMPTALLDMLVELVGALRGDTSGDVTGTAVGIGAPGLVDRSGTVRFSPNLPGIVDLEVCDELARRTGSRVTIENDATCACWGEAKLGAARSDENVVLVTLGTGIGGGFMIGGQLVRGAHGFAGEIGHVVVNPNGPQCPCGHRGCWERYASGSGLGWMGREAGLAGRARRVVQLAGGDPEAVRGEHVTRAAAESDEEARVVMDRFAWWLALGLANLANTFDPDRIVIGGGMVCSGDVLLAPTRRAFANLIEAAEYRPVIPIVAAMFGERAGAVGAALLARGSDG